MSDYSDCGYIELQDLAPVSSHVYERINEEHLESQINRSSAQVDQAVDNVANLANKPTSKIKRVLAVFLKLIKLFIVFCVVCIIWEAFFTENVNSGKTNLTVCVCHRVRYSNILSM